MVKRIILLFCLSTINGYFFNFLNDKYFHLTTHVFGQTPKMELLFISVVAAPIAETYLLQYLPNLILTKLRVKNTFLLIVLPSILFAFGHTYFWLYVFMTFFSGLILNYLFLYLKGKTPYYILITMLFHAMYNLFGFLFVA